ncbi:hypothetical protein FA13DRAFT_1738760 [Coprinellus micaceus]|uniref:Uncharacterized protein n=1 Tax=Coprinellus micaceus TaxID=71717 RepID=A0A4Y7SSU9_COPMI|nr:hypothetical protein FA13DRAFT_1738760 [Coprinellus micaceus]
MATYKSPYPLIPIPDFEPQTKGIVRPNAPQRLSLAVAPLMSQRSILFRVRTELEDGEVEDYSQLSDNSGTSSMQLISAEPGPSNASSSTASVPPSSRVPPASSSLEPPSSSLSSASAYSQESYLLASSKGPLTGAKALTPAVATAASATLGIPFSARTPASARARRGKPRTPLSSAKARARPRLRPRPGRGNARRRGGAKDDDGEEHRRFAMAFSPSVGLPWESLVFGGEEHSPIVNLEIAGMRASRGYPDEDEGFGDEELEEAWEDEVGSEEEDGSTTPKTGDPSRWVRAQNQAPTGDEGILKDVPVPSGTRRRPVSIIRGKLKAKRGHQRTPSESASQASPASSVIINNLPTFTPLRRALSRMTAQSAVRNEKADLPTGLRRTKSQLLSPIADADVETDSLAQYWSPAVSTPAAPSGGMADAKEPTEDAKQAVVDKERDKDLPSTPSPSPPATGQSQIESHQSILSITSKFPIPPPHLHKLTALQVHLTSVSVGSGPASSRPTSFPPPPPIPDSPAHAPPLSPAPASLHRKLHKRYLSSPALLNFRPSDLPAPPPPMPNLKVKLAQLGLADGKNMVGLPARTRATVAVVPEKKRERKPEEKALRKTLATARRRTVGAKERKVEKVSPITKEMIGEPIPVPKHGPGSS